MMIFLQEEIKRPDKGVFFFLIHNDNSKTILIPKILDPSDRGLNVFHDERSESS